MLVDHEILPMQNRSSFSIPSDEVLQQLEQKEGDQGGNIQSPQLFRWYELPDRCQDRFGDFLHEPDEGVGRIGRKPGQDGANDDDPRIEIQKSVNE
jgi:hypothetical protein